MFTKLKAISLVVILCLLSNAYSFIENIRNEEILKNNSIAHSYFKTHNDKFYSYADRCLAQYQILENGGLEHLKSIQLYSVNGCEFQIYDDLMYIARHEPYTGGNRISVYDFSSDVMELVTDFPSVSDNANGRALGLTITEDYIFEAVLYLGRVYVYDRHTYEYITMFQNGVRPIITNEQALFLNGENNITSFTLYDISDINSPIEKTTIELDGYIYPLNYQYHDSLHYVLCLDKMLTIDFSDSENIIIETVIDSIPNISNEFRGFEFTEDGVILNDMNHSLWKYTYDSENDFVLQNFIPGNQDLWYSIPGIETYGDFFYLSDYYDCIRQISLSSLNDGDYEIIDTFGERGFFDYEVQYVENWLLVPNYPVTASINMSDDNNTLNENLPYFTSILHLPEHSKFIATSYDSIMVYQYNETEITQLNSIPNPNSFRKLGKFNEYITLSSNYANGGDADKVQICTFTDDNELIEVDFLHFDFQMLLLDINKSCELDFIPFSSNLNTRIIFLDANPPFDIIAEYDSGRLYFLEDGNVAKRLNTQNSLRHYRLCEFTFPEQFEVYANLYMQYPHMFDDYFIEGYTSNVSPGLLKFSNFRDFEYNTLLEYQFPPNTRCAYLNPDKTKLYAVGPYAIYRYDCDYTEVDNEDNIIESKPKLLSNYQNPFSNSANSRNSGTNISFSIEKRSDVEISVYNTKGQKVKTVTKENYDAGEHSVYWNGKNESNKKVASGVYLYRMNVDGRVVQTNKCLVVK